MAIRETGHNPQHPASDLSPEETPNTASWDEHYGNVGMNELNHPVPERKGNPAVNGWDGQFVTDPDRGWTGWDGDRSPKPRSKSDGEKDMPKKRGE